MKRNKSLRANHSPSVNGGMLLIFLVIAFFVYYPFTLTGEEYIKIIGEDKDDYGHCIKFDQGRLGKDSLIIVGSTESFGNGYRDALITKLERSGPGYSFVHAWSKHIGKEGLDAANSVAIDSKGYYVLCGYVSQSASDQDLLLAKFTKDGTKLFARTYDVNLNNRRDLAQKLIVDKDDNYVIVGTTNSAGSPKCDILVARFSSDGDFDKGITIGNQEALDWGDWGMAIIQDSMGHYVVAGYSDKDLVMFKLEPQTFKLIKQVRIQWYGYDFSVPYAVVDDPAFTSPTMHMPVDSYVVAGFAKFRYQRNPWLLIFRIDYTLNDIIWANVLTPHNKAGFNFYECATSLIKTMGGNFVVSGFSQAPFELPLFGFAPTSNALFVWFDKDGNEIRTKTMVNNIQGPTLKYYKMNRSYCITSHPHPSQPLEKVYVATGLTSLSHFGGSDLLVASFDYNSSKCLKNEERDSLDIRGYLSFYAREEKCEMAHENIEPKDFTPKVKVICSPLPNESQKKKR